jgi:peptide/nickel transport system ATP-binding protein
MNNPVDVINVSHLQTQFRIPEGMIRAVDDISFAVRTGETLGVVGESGCGKSVTALSIMQLISPPGRITGGTVSFQGKDLLRLPSPQMRAIRGHQISMIFQEPMTSLNPVYTVGDQISEAYREHLGVDRKEAWDRTIEMLDKVRIPSPERRVFEYPHQLSGGMRQRVMIAMALACNPKLLIADEPTTALDVTIQAQIFNLILNLQGELGMAIVLITHNLGIVAETAQRVMVMYCGRVVEEADVSTLFDHPLHPYTQGLLHSIPIPGHKTYHGKKRLEEIPGQVPSLFNLPAGCHFHNRCQRPEPVCLEKGPRLAEVETNHQVACWALSRD